MFPCLYLDKVNTIGKIAEVKGFLEPAICFTLVQGLQCLAIDAFQEHLHVVARLHLKAECEPAVGRIGEEGRNPSTCYRIDDSHCTYSD